MVEVETHPLASEIEHINDDFPDDSNSLLSPLDGLKPAPSSEDSQNEAQMTKPPEPNETETEKFDDTLLKCLECKKVFKKRWNLKEHMRSHSNERPFECSFCHAK